MDRQEMLNKIGDYLILNLYNHSIIRNLSLEDISEIIGSLSANSIELLKKNRFITSSEVQEFIKCLPRVLMQIEISSEKYYEKGFNIKGNINWNLTIKEQMNSGGLPYYIYLTKKKKFDNPSNRLLKWVLLKIKEVCKDFKKRLENNTEVFKEKEKIKKTMKDILVDTIRMVDTGLNLDFIGSVSNLKKVPESYVNTIKRTFGYSQLVNVYNLYKDLIEENNDDIFNKYLVNNILEPVDSDKLFELYVLFTTIKAINEINGVKAEKVDVLGQKEMPVASYKYSLFTIKVWYQCIPGCIKESSKYKELIKKLELENVQTRRPDIVVSIEDKERSYRFIIEVKHSKNKSYIMDSVYKMFGYFKDFEISLNKATKGILVVDKGISSYRQNKSEIWVITHDKIEESIKNLIMSVNEILD